MSSHVSDPCRPRAAGRSGANLWLLVLAASFVAVPLEPADAKRRAGLHGPGHHHGHHYRRYPYYHGGPFRTYPYLGYYDDAPRPYWTREQRRAAEAERGWAYLEKGDAKRALSVFARRARRDDRDAHAKLGYAIASAEIGDVDRGVWAMRHAALTDASALDGAPLGDRTRERILDLVKTLHGTEHGDDAHFLVAALLFTAGDLGGAQAAIDWAAEGGDSEPSTLVLRDAIRARGSAAVEESGDESPSSS